MHGRRKVKWWREGKEKTGTTPEDLKAGHPRTTKRKQAHPLKKQKLERNGMENMGTVEIRPESEKGSGLAGAYLKHCPRKLTPGYR